MPRFIRVREAPIGPRSGRWVEDKEVVIPVITGEQGLQGLKGEKGDMGPQGIQGVTGPQGTQGPQGPPGVPGPTGANGVDGQDGGDGATGPQGIAGPAGETGATGPTGAAGLQGPQGNTGDAGSDGNVGPQGPIGLTGPTGPQGQAGTAGSQGEQGPQGPAGNDATLPAGVIVMWSGLLADIPSGWALCDGQGGRPDLRSRFIKGAAAGIDPGGTGGNLTHTHANHSNLTHSGTAVTDHPAHTHTYSQVPNHVHVQRLQGGTTGSNTGTHLMGSTATGGSLRSSAQSTLDPTGGSAQGTTNAPNATLSHSVTQPNDHAISAHDSVNHEPPYFALAFIIKL